MSTAQIDKKLSIALRISHLLKDRIALIIHSKLTYPNAHAPLKKLREDLQRSCIQRFVQLGRKILSEYYASTAENSPLSIPVERVIKEFTDIEKLINNRLSTSKGAFKRTFFFAANDRKNELLKLQKNLTSLNEIFNMLRYPTPNIIDKNLSENVPTHSDLTP